MATNIKEAYRRPNIFDQKTKSPHCIIIKTLYAQNKEKVLNAVRDKGQVTYKGRLIRITPDL